MRKSRDFDAAIQALTDRTNTLRTKRQGQLGELVIAAGADALSIEQLADALLDSVAADAARKEAWCTSGAAFFREHDVRARGARDTACEPWQAKRRERTRRLIELGGLVTKAGIVELTDDDRAAILGLLAEAAGKLRGHAREAQLLMWRRRGRRLFALGRPQADDRIPPNPADQSD